LHFREISYARSTSIHCDDVVAAGSASTERQQQAPGAQASPSLARATRQHWKPQHRVAGVAIQTSEVLMTNFGRFVTPGGNVGHK